MFQVGGKLQILFADFSFRERRGGCLSLGLGGLGIQDGGTLIRFGRLLVGNSDAGFSFFLDSLDVGTTYSGALL